MPLHHDVRSPYPACVARMGSCGERVGSCGEGEGSSGEGVVPSAAVMSHSTTPGFQSSPRPSHYKRLLLFWDESSLAEWTVAATSRIAPSPARGRAAGIPALMFSCPYMGPSNSLPIHPRRCRPRGRDPLTGWFDVLGHTQVHLDAQTSPRRLHRTEGIGHHAGLWQSARPRGRILTTEGIVILGRSCCP